MPVFAYKALAPGGEVLTGRVSAASRDAAIDQLKLKRLAPLTVEPAKDAPRTPAALTRLFPRRRPNGKDLLLFTRQLGILLTAGAPIDRALAKLDDIARDGALAGVPGALLATVKGGGGLSDAMQARADVFPAFYVGMIRAGEAGARWRRCSSAYRRCWRSLRR